MEEIEGRMMEMVDWHFFRWKNVEGPTSMDPTWAVAVLQVVDWLRGQGWVRVPSGWDKVVKG